MLRDNVTSIPIQKYRSSGDVSRVSQARRETSRRADRNERRATRWRRGRGAPAARHAARRYFWLIKYLAKVSARCICNAEVRERCTNQPVPTSVSGFHAGENQYPSALSYFRYLRHGPSHTSLAVASMKRHSLNPLASRYSHLSCRKFAPTTPK